MRKQLIEAILQPLRAPITAKARFNIPLSPEEVESVLHEAYRRVVEERGGIVCESDVETLNKIRSVANWLTAEKGKPCLLLQGTVGNGKTTMLKAIALAIETIRSSTSIYLRANRWRMIGTALEVFHDRLAQLPYVRYSTAQEIAASISDELEKIKRQRFLIIDDVGVEPSKVKLYGTELTPIADVIYYRYDLLSPTIISTNLNNRELHERYGERILDRLTECCDRLIYTAPSYRE